MYLNARQSSQCEECNEGAAVRWVIGAAQAQGEDSRSAAILWRRESRRASFLSEKACAKRPTENTSLSVSVMTTPCSHI